MVNEIKMDKINNYLIQETMNKDTQQSAPAQSGVEKSASAEISVTNRLNDIIKTVNTYEDPIHQAALNDIKYRVQHNEYKIDLDKLSEKLLGSGIFSTIRD